MILELKPWWPDVFLRAGVHYPDTRQGKRDAVADGRVGWANCMAGHTPPSGFGTGMVIIGQALGISATPDELTAMGEKLLAQKTD